MPRTGSVDLEVGTESIRHIGAAVELVHAFTLGRMPELLVALIDLIETGRALLSQSMHFQGIATAEKCRFPR